MNPRAPVRAAAALAALAPGSGFGGAWAAQESEPDNAGARAPTADLVTVSRGVMGTTFQVMLVADDRRDAARKAAEVALDEAARIEQMMSEWKPGSPLSRINALAGAEAVEVPPELLAILRRSLEISVASAGAFDPSWAALWDLWRFDRPPRVPSRQEVSSRLPLVSYRDVVIDPSARSVFLRRRGMLLGLGGIAKGYALDRAAALLRGRGFRDFVLDAGGQVLASGMRGARPWRVGIRDPRQSARWFAVLELRDASLSTSGDYEHFFIVDGVRYHHILDVQTGYPARGCRSVTVLAPEAATADALSTAAFIMGPKAGLRLLRQFPGAEGVVVDAENRVHVSKGLGQRMVVGPPSP